MNDRDIDRIVGKYTKVLKPKRTDKTLTPGTVVTIDSEYHLPVHNPYTPEKLKEKLRGSELPTEFTEPREPFRTFCMAHGDRVARWKPDRPVTLEEFLKWILSNLASWSVTPENNRVIVCCHLLISELQHIESLASVMRKIKRFGAGVYGEADFTADHWENFNPPGYKVEVEHGAIRFAFVDTYVLFGMSLEKLTDGTPHQKPKDEEIWHGYPWKYWRAHPHLLFAEDEDAFWKYAEGDVLGLWWCVDHWRKWIWNRWSIDILRTKTFSNIGLRIFQSRISEPTEPYVKEQRLTKKGRPQTVVEFDHTKEDIRRFFLRMYKAGYRVSFIRGLVPGPVYAYDLVKLYCTSAILQPLPGPHTEYVQVTDEDNLEQYEGALDVEFEFPDTIQYPTLAVVHDKFPKLVCPRRGRTVDGVAAVRLAKRLGAKIHIVDSCVFKPTEAEINHPLRKVLQEIINLANEGKGMPQERFMKNIANGLIGKLFQRNRLEALEESWIEQTTYATSSWSPILAALILSKARCILSEIMQLGVGVYTHTDSFFSKTPIDLNAPIIQQLEKYGSGLSLQDTYQPFWTPRSAVRYGVAENGRVDVARGGISSEHERFAEILRQKIGNPNAQNDTIFITTKMAPFEGKYPLGHEVLKITRTDFSYDHKRKLVNPAANLWTEASDSVTWTNIDELLEYVTATSKTGKHETLETLFNRVKASQGKVGRPRVVNDWDLLEMLKMLVEGASKYEVARRFRDKYSRMTIYRVLSKI